IVAVVGPLRLEDLAAPGVSAGEADRVLDAFRPRTSDSDLLMERVPLQDDLGKLSFGQMRPAIHGPRLKLPGHRLDDPRVPVPHDQHPLRCGAVEVLVAVGVPYPGTLGPAEIQRVGAPGTQIAANPGGEHLGSLLPVTGRGRGA